MANTPRRRRLFLELCEAYLGGRVDDAREFVRVGGFRAISACLTATPALRGYADRALAACCAGLGSDEKVEAEMWNLTVV